MFRDEGIPVVDADAIARDVVEPGRPAHAEIVEAFGREILSPDGRIDRGTLGAIVFASREARERLEGITHPRIAEGIGAALSRLAGEGHRVVIVEAALIFESERKGMFREVIATWCDPEEQIRRLCARDGISREQAAARISSQMKAAEKARLADHAIDTSGSLEDTRRRVRELAALFGSPH